MATTKIINDLIDLNQTGNTTALKGCVGDNAQQPTVPTISVEYLVLGGGGGGGGFGQAGGGGGGGFSTGTIAVPNNTAVNIVIGQGGAGGTGALPATGANGQDSGFYQIQGQGGGAGAGDNGSGTPGGSGGGSGSDSGAGVTGGAGVSGQGNSGGDASNNAYDPQYNGSGGGGAGLAGSDGNNAFGYGGDGSDVVVLGIITQANAATAGVGETNGAKRNFAGGGGGGSFGNALGTGGDGGGGNGNTGDGATAVVSNGSPGTINTGGGGGGAGSYTSGNTGGSGGSGVVILKYANADVSSITIGGSLAGGITTGTTADCNYPVTATALYQLNSDGGTTNNVPDTCSTYNGTGASITYSAGKFGNAADFNGSSSFINTNYTKSGTAFSFSCWVNLNDTSSRQYIFGDFDSGGADTSCSAYFQVSANDNLILGVGNGSSPTSMITLTSGMIGYYNQWVHFAVIINGTSGIIYRNGTSVLTGTFSFSMQNGINTIALGMYSASAGSGELDGQLDQVRIFPSALTADQVAMLYAENVGATKFDDGTNTTLVFKGGTGTINLTGSSVLGPKVGDLRTNTDQTSNTSISAMEHYMSTGWRVFTNTAPPVDIYYLVIAGGGGGGAGGAATGAGGGGGGGGYRNSFSTEYSGGLTSTESPIVLVTGSPYTVTVGAGGSAGSVGADSIFSTITSTGGGFGQTTKGPGGSGGSGGGGWGSTTWSPPPGPGLAVSPTQGFNGGYQDGAAPGAGGGGAGAQGVNINTGNYAAGGNAGAGLTSNIDTLGIGRAGGGGGGSYSSGSGSTGGGTASDGGGTGGGSSSTAGTTNKGGGGGGGNGGDAVSRSGAAGGSGVVILRYPTASVASFSITGTINTPTPVISGTDSIITFTTIGTGTITFS